MQRKKISSDKIASKKSQPRPRRNFTGDLLLAGVVGTRIVKGLEGSGGRKSHAMRLLKSDEKLNEVLDVLMRDDRPILVRKRLMEVLEALVRDDKPIPAHDPVAALRSRRASMAGQSFAEAAQAWGDAPADKQKPRARQKRRTK